MDIIDKFCHNSATNNQNLTDLTPSESSSPVVSVEIVEKYLRVNMHQRFLITYSASKLLLGL